MISGLMILGGVALVLFLIAAMSIKSVLNLRRVVPTNEVHIVQTRKSTISYGKEMAAGNTYYQWPSWLPVIGLNNTILPVSVFDIKLQNYDAYDTNRVPFKVDIVAFFRINESNVAAQNVADFRQLVEQLTNVVQGAVRTTLASHEINSIMVERSKFGAQFTQEVADQLKQWGVETVKNIELMDIRDVEGSRVVHNIMSKQTSEIEQQSRVVVAANKQKAEIAEIEAQRAIDIQAQDAQQQVGQRAAEREQAVGIANEQALQAVKSQQKTTAERDQDVIQVQQVRQSEIARDVALVKADQTKKTAIIAAEGTQQQTVITAEGNLEAKKREAEGIQVTGLAKAAAEEALLKAPVNAQITLAKEIGENDGYQRYLLGNRQIEAAQAVGTEQAKALGQADVKVISNSGSPAEGLTGVMDLFSSKGGTSIAGLLEALSQSDVGKSLLDAVTKGGDDKGTKPTASKTAK